MLVLRGSWATGAVQLWLCERWQRRVRDLGSGQLMDKTHQTEALRDRNLPDTRKHWAAIGAPALETALGCSFMFDGGVGFRQLWVFNQQVASSAIGTAPRRAGSTADLAGNGSPGVSYSTLTLRDCAGDIDDRTVMSCTVMPHPQGATKIANEALEHLELELENSAEQ